MPLNLFLQKGQRQGRVSKLSWFCLIGLANN